MSDPQTGTGAAGSIPPCPSSVCSDPAVQRAVAELCRENGWPPGTQVIVMGPDGKYCYCTCGGAGTAARAEGAAVQPCSAERCRELRSYVDEACHDLSFPPGSKLLIMNPDGSVCYCICGEG